MKNRRDFLKTVGTVGATGIAAAVGVESTVDAQTPAAKPAPASAPVSHAYTFSYRARSGVHRSGGRSADPCRRPDARRHRLRRRDLHRSPARRRMGQRRPHVHAGAVAEGRADAGLPVAADAGGVLPRGRSPRPTPTAARRFRRTSIGSPSISRSKSCRTWSRVGSRSTACRRAGVLQPAARDGDAGLLRGSGLRRQPRQGGVEDDRLPRRHRDLLGTHQDVPQQEVTTSSRRASSIFPEDHHGRHA